MIKNYGQADPKLAQYFESQFTPEDATLAEIRERSQKMGIPQIHVSNGDGLHLEVLTRAIGARKAVEIGTLAGYSAVCIARGLPTDGRLFTFEADPKHAGVAEETFKRAGVAAKVRTFTGAALERLHEIESQGPFDLVFIDADKVNYPNYLAWAEKHLRKGGVVLADNTFAWGLVVEETYESAEDEAAAKAIREFNKMAAQGGKFRSTLLPTGEGLTMAVKL